MECAQNDMVVTMAFGLPFTGRVYATGNPQVRLFSSGFRFRIMGWSGRCVTFLLTDTGLFRDGQRTQYGDAEDPLGRPVRYRATGFVICRLFALEKRRND